MMIGVNGKCIPEQQAVVSVYDHGFLYGIGLFETMRTYDGVPFMLGRHLRRLAEGCAYAGIAYEPIEQQLRDHIAELLDVNGLSDAYVRISVSAGRAPLGLPEGDYGQPNLIVYVKPLTMANKSDGKSLQLLQMKRSSPEVAVRLKSFQYMNNVLAKREMLAYPWAAGAEGLFTDARGFVAEGIVSNLFFVSGGRIYTPSLATGILPGVTRELVIELAAQFGVQVEEGLYTFDRLCDADEIWLTGSVQEIVPVHSIYDTTGRLRWQTGSSIWIKRLQESYERYVMRYVEERQ